MSYTFLQEQGEESSVESFSDIPAYVLLRLNLTAEKSCSNGNEMESFRSSQSGMMFEPSTGNRGEEMLMSCAADSRVKTLALPAKVKELMVPVADSGEKWQEWFAKFDPDSCSWKIRQLWLFADLDESLEIWPRWGLMRDGVCLEQKKSEDIATDNESGLLPRPQKVDGQKWYVVTQQSTRKRIAEGRQLMLIHVVGLTAYEHLSRWLANPPFWEAMMDWPIGWTDCTPLATGKFQQWLNSHGDASHLDTVASDTAPSLT
jgi:hypothetical protein